jgi:hypothetical protein
VTKIVEGGSRLGGSSGQDWPHLRMVAGGDVVCPTLADLGGQEGQPSGAVMTSAPRSWLRSFRVNATALVRPDAVGSLVQVWSHRRANQSVSIKVPSTLMRPSAVIFASPSALPTGPAPARRELRICRASSRIWMPADEFGPLSLQPLPSRCWLPSTVWRSCLRLGTRTTGVRQTFASFTTSTRLRQDVSLRGESL